MFDSGLPGMRVSQGQKVNYDDFETRDKGRQGNTTGKRPSNDNYEATTLELIAVVEQYMTLSPYDKQRPVLVAQIQKVRSR